MLNALRLTFEMVCTSSFSVCVERRKAAVLSNYPALSVINSSGPKYKHQCQGFKCGFYFFNIDIRLFPTSVFLYYLPSNPLRYTQTHTDTQRHTSQTRDRHVLYSFSFFSHTVFSPPTDESQGFNRS